MVANLLPRPTNVRSAAKHALVGDDSNGEVVSQVGVVLSVHDFGGHVPRSARCVLRVLIALDTRDSKVSDAEVAVALNDEVLWLNVAVNYVFFVDIFQALHETRNEESSLFFVEFAFCTEVVPQVPPREIVHYQVEVFAILEREMHVDNVRVLQVREDRALVHY